MIEAPIRILRAEPFRAPRIDLAGGRKRPFRIPKVLGRNLAPSAAGPFILSFRAAFCCRKVTVGFFGEGHRNRAGRPGLLALREAHPRLSAPQGTWPRLPDGGAFFCARRLGTISQTIPKSANIMHACGVHGSRWRKDASLSTFLG
jgi:hypothetical protein